MYVIAISALSLSAHFFLNASCALNEGFLYYVMLSRCSCLENIFLDDKFDLEMIQCKRQTLKEAERLDAKSIAKKMSEETLDIFCINVRSFSKHVKDILSDPFAKQAKYICLTETWIEPDKEDALSIEDKVMYHSSFGKGKGCSIMSSEKRENHR